jgi:Cysteine rich repeat
MTYFSGNQVKWFSVMASVFLLTVAAGVSAQQKPDPCAGDAARLCKGMPQGEGCIAQCLKAHARELSPACRESAAAAKGKIQDFASACKEEMKKLCEGTRPGGGRILQCLRQHETALSSACKEQMTQAKRK